MKLLRVLGVTLLTFMLAFSVPVAALAGTKTITLAWDHDGVDLNHFTLHYGTTQGGAYATQVEITGLQPDDLGVYQTEEIIIAPDGETTTYYFVVTASDSEGNESGYSNEISYTVDFEAPGQPYGLRIIITTE